MNLIIKLPPKAERDDLVKAWVNGVTNGTDFSEFQSFMGHMVESGFSPNGITCLFLHDSTTKMIVSALKKEIDSQWLEPAFSVPICLN